MKQLPKRFLRARDISRNEKYIYYYTELTVTSATDVEVAKIGIYPNPTTDKVYFSAPDAESTAVFQLFDARGRKVISKQITLNEFVSLNTVNAGVFVYNLYINGQKQTGTIIKQ